MDAWSIWLIVAVVLIILEVLTQMVWTLCLAVGCLVGLLLSIFSIDIFWQIVVSAISAVVAFIWLMPVFKHWHDKSNHRQNRDDRTGMDALLGRHAIVTQEILPGKLGRARIDGDNWQVSSSSPFIIPRGTEVIVTSYDSIILHVQLITPKQ